MMAKFIWFKYTGKYYSEGELQLPDTLDFNEALDTIKDMLDNGIRPGLISGHHFNCLVTINEQVHLFIRGQNINI